jgi:hypothetical protein
MPPGIITGSFEPKVYVAVIVIVYPLASEYDRGIGRKSEL